MDTQPITALLATYPGIDGFLGTRGSLMLDLVFLSMFLVVPLMLLSIYLVKFQKRYLLHKRIQIGLASVLAITVTLFEIDIRVNGWRARAHESPYYSQTLSEGFVNWSLWVHLLFSVTTALLWIYVVIQALRKIPNPPGPGPYSRQHVFWARLAALDMVFTALTGCLFYYLAFVAS
jgi:putative membrane protein